MRASRQLNRGETRRHRLTRAVWATLASVTLVATGTGLAYATDLDSSSEGAISAEEGIDDSATVAQSFKVTTENNSIDEDSVSGSSALVDNPAQSGNESDQQTDDDSNEAQAGTDLDLPQSEDGLSEGDQLGARLLQTPTVEPFAAPGTATVKVTARVAATGDASGTTGIGFTLYDGNTPTSYSCSVDSDAGECSIEVPTAGLGKAYRVVQTSTPGNLFPNPQLYVQGQTGASGSATRQINYPAGMTPVLQSTNEVSMPADAVITATGGASSARDRSLGNILSSHYNVARNTCVAVQVAGLIDVSTSITDAQLTQYRNGIKQGIDGLIGTGASLQLFTFGTTSPASGTAPSPRLLVDAAGATTLKAWVDTNVQRSAVGTQYTNWAAGINAVKSAGSTDPFTAMLLVTDGAPNRPTSDNMSDTNVRALEEAIYAANGIKAGGTRSIGVGIGLGAGVAQTNLRAVSDPLNFYNVANFQGLGDLLTSLGADLTACTARISVTKFQGNGPDDASSVALPNWPVNAILDDPATGVTISPATSQQTGVAGEPASWTVTLPTESSTFDATISETVDDSLPFQTGRYRVVSGTPGPWVVFDASSFAVTGLGVGNDIEVEFYNNELPSAPEWTLTKSSDPITESSVSPGQTITYTLTATNTSTKATLNGATAEDDLSNVLNNAVLTQPLAAGLSLAGTSLTWDVPTLAPGANVSVNYTVTVNQGAYGVTIGNVVTAGDEVPPPSNCGDNGVCGETEHYTPAWDLTKSSNPASGSTVDPGDTITYTLTAKNTSDVARLVGATAEDDLSEVLNGATLVEPLAAGLTLNGTKLTWDFGTIDPGKTATVSYQVVVNQDAVGVTIGNVVTGKGDIPPSPCPESNADCRETAHHTPSWSLVKSSNPEDGSTVNPGSSVTYTLTATNTSNTAILRGLTVTDDLSNVLNNAAKVGGPTASAGVVFYNPVIATQLIWTIDELAPGETATATYTVKINDGAYGVTIANVATGEGPVPPDPCPTTDESCRETRHFTPAWDLTKSSDPVSGSTVAPGETITYTLTATNTSENAVLEGATAEDDLSQVLNNAALTEPLAEGLVLNGTTLTWSIPDLAPGETVSVDYAATVSSDAHGVDIGNVVVGEGPVPPSPCSDESAKCRETKHYTPAWHLQKSSDPKSGSVVIAGQTVTYTLTATNTSNATVEGAKAVDDLSKVLNNATLVTPLDGSLKLEGTELIWDLPTLKPGEDAKVSYKVKVNDIKTSISLVNVVKPVTPGGECLENQCSTNHSGKLPGRSGQLPDTGTNGAMTLVVGAGLLLLGGLGFGVSRRRRRGDDI
ncbi:LPXTG cell wall anchor domain-containing protein [Actinomycetaceae bacterium MB13-C1-2]|nr:LPXTG cell wall anchor domain-containing protein [Actinomycetaceae bacterium MB13-C1-2]